MRNVKKSTLSTLFVNFSTLFLRLKHVLSVAKKVSSASFCVHQLKGRLIGQPKYANL